MSQLTYSTPSGFVATLSKANHYSQAVRLPYIDGKTIVKISGQGGWDAQTGEINTKDMEAQLNTAFSNVADVLHNAGSKGWDDVYLIRAYFSRIHEDGLSDAWPKVAGKWLPNHEPVLTAFAVGALWLEEMRIEIEVEALVDSK